MKITLIWAEGHDRAIGRNNSLPWHIPEDFAHFRAVTAGKPVLMGRRTWDSLPRKPLPGRTNMVISRELTEVSGAEVFASVAAALEAAMAQGFGELVIIGGAQLYERFLGIADKVWVTRVDVSVPDADAFAPALDMKQWRTGGIKVLAPDAAATLYVRAS
jgi:dihydrofolate reductase